MENILMPRTKEEVLEAAERYNVKFIRMWFVDLLGLPKNFAIPVEELETALDYGLGFDGSSIAGYQEIQESDMVAKPIPSTFRILPWRPMEQAVARMFCEIYYPDGRRYECDPRYILERNLQYAKEKFGLEMFVGPELEFFVFKNSEKPELLDKGGYFDFTTLDHGVDVRRHMILAMEQMGIRAEYSHHEVGPSQHEIDMRYTDALTMADNVITYRVAAKEIAQQFGYYATFMPKPLFGENGSGMHTHISLHRDGQNVFPDPNDPYNLSDIAKKFIAGLLRHVRELCLLYAQWVNSYKRLVPGYEAPVYISWARANRSALVRVPTVRPERLKSVRAEFRTPDPACNPYLAFAAMLRSGLKGIEEDYELPDPVEKNIYHLPEEERKALGIETLPETLGEAIRLFEQSELAREILGEPAFEHLLSLKKKEWDEFKAWVTEWEIQRYYHML